MKYVKCIGTIGHYIRDDYYLAEIIRYDKSRDRYYCCVLPQYRSVVREDCWFFDVGQYEFCTGRYEIIEDEQLTIFNS